MMGVRAIINPDLGGSAEGGHYEVQLPVMVKVPDGSATMTPRRLRRKTGFLGECVKLRPLEVAKDGIGLIDCLAAGHVGRLHVTAADENILPSVIVKIGVVRAVARHGTALQRHAALCGYVREPGFSVVAIDRERFLVQTDENDIRTPVVIEIAKIDTPTRDYVSLLRERNSRLERDFFKDSISVVVEEKIEELVDGNEYVGQAVTVVVGDAHSHALPRMRAN